MIKLLEQFYSRAMQSTEGFDSRKKSSFMSILPLLLAVITVEVLVLLVGKFLWNNYLVTDSLAVNLGIIHQGESVIKTGSSAVLPAYTRVDAGASYGLTENTRVQVNVENLTDELYFPHSHSTHQASVGAPINATFSITSKF